MKTKTVKLERIVECGCGEPETHLERESRVTVIDGAKICEKCYEHGIRKELRAMTTLKETPNDERSPKSISELI